MFTILFMNTKRTAFLFQLIIISTLFNCMGTEKTIENENKSLDEIYRIPPSFNFKGTVAPWFNFKKAAFSVTLDDGTLDQYTVAWPEMEKAGIKGTFFLAPDLIDKGEWDDNGTLREMMDWSQAKEIALSGHEIGSHSYNHIDMSLEGVDYLVELRDSRNYIENRIPGIKVETFCWPHWRETSKAMELSKKYYISARSGNGIISYYLDRKGGIPGSTPENMYAVNALGILNTQTEEEWKKIFDTAYLNNSWFVASYHGVKTNSINQNSIGWNALDKQQFIETLLYPKESGYWIDTFGNVSKYIYERDAAILHLKNDSFSIKINLNDNLEDKTYNQPLTISLIKPENWPYITVIDDSGLEIPYDIEDGMIYMNIIPDGKQIEVKPLLTVDK